MMTKRVVRAGAGASNVRVARQRATLLLAVTLLGATALACKSGNSGEASPADPGPAAPQGASVVRYTGMEVAETGQVGIRQAVQARRAADWTSTSVTMLYPGTQVSRVARYGNYSLVAWTGAGGAQQGWVDSNVAFAAVRLDAGVMKPAPVFGAATVVPPPTATTPPKPTPTATTTAPRTGFTPPKLQ